MSVTIQCPSCNARLVIKDESVLGKKVACPKCQKPFRTAGKPKPSPLLAPQPELVQPEVVKPEVVKPATRVTAAKPTVARPVKRDRDEMIVDDPAASTTHNSFDFTDIGQAGPSFSDPVLGPAVGSPTSSAWAAPTREVAVVKTVSNEERLAKERRRDRVFAFVGVLVGGLLLVFLVVAGWWYISRSVTKEKEMAAASEFGRLEPSRLLSEALGVMLPVQGDAAQLSYSELESVYPNFMDTTEKQENLLAENKPIRDIARVEGFQTTAIRHWLQLGPMPGFDGENQVHRETRARIVAALLRQAILDKQSTAPDKEKWEALLYAEQAMFDQDALTKKAIKDTAPDSLQRLVEKLETWAPSLDFEMPKRRQTAMANSSEGSSSSDQPEPGKANLPTIFGFDAKKRALMVDYLREQGHSQAKARLTMAMVATALGKTADDLNIARGEAFPEELTAVREAVAFRVVPRELLMGRKVPAIFSKLIADYQSEKLKPEEEDLVLYIVVAFLAPDMR